MSEQLGFDPEEARNYEETTVKSQPETIEYTSGSGLIETTKYNSGNLREDWHREWEEMLNKTRIKDQYFEHIALRKSLYDADPSDFQRIIHDNIRHDLAWIRYTRSDIEEGWDEIRKHVYNIEHLAYELKQVYNPKRLSNSGVVNITSEEYQELLDAITDASHMARQRYEHVVSSQHLVRPAEPPESGTLLRPHEATNGNENPDELLRASDQPEVNDTPETRP